MAKIKITKTIKRVEIKEKDYTPEELEKYLKLMEEIENLNCEDNVTIKYDYNFL